MLVIYVKTHVLAVVVLVQTEVFFSWVTQAGLPRHKEIRNFGCSFF